MSDEAREIEDKARRTLSLALKGFSLSLCDVRLPPPDVMGVFSDCQVRTHHLNKIVEEVDQNWEGVCQVCIGYFYRSSRPYFEIHIEPFSKDLQRQHWTLKDKIGSIIGNTTDFDYLFLPKIEEPWGNDIIIYQRGSCSSASK